MDKIVSDTQSSLNISEDVVATIANEAVKELPGVYSLSNLPVKVGTLTAPGMPSKPVRILITADTAVVEIGIIVNLSYKIREVAEQVQTAVKSAVQSMTGITVSKVNVYVAEAKLSENQ